MLHATQRATRDLFRGGAPTNLVETFGIILRGGPFFRQRGAASTLARRRARARAVASGARRFAFRRSEPPAGGFSSRAFFPINGDDARHAPFFVRRLPVGRG